jgi:2-dehydro-3-deoxyphosphooctonate aldolase (KDO 8-P synthase)
MELYRTLCSSRFVIAGPCIIESEDMLLEIAEKCIALTEERGFTYIFKASFDKANRTSGASYRGNGMEKGLDALKKVKETFSIPVTTDIHESWQAPIAAEVVDILQIPAFLCRQTDLLTAAGNTGRIVNIKKAQFLSAADMGHSVRKVFDTNNRKVMLTERGSMFGYNNLVVDFRNLVDMREYGAPVIMDVTHSTQRPGGLGNKSGGDRRYAPVITAAAAAIGVDGYFFETHPDPDNALSDGPNMIPLDKMGMVLDIAAYHQAGPAPE